MQESPLAKKIKFADDFQMINNLDEVKELVDQLYASDKIIGFDIETGYKGDPVEGRSLNMFHPLQFIAGFSITNDPSWARYIPLRHDMQDDYNVDPEKTWELMKPLLEDKVGVAHNLSFEASNLRQLDKKGDGPRIEIPVSKWHDSMISAYVLSDIPPIEVWGALRDGELVRRYVPETFRTDDDYMEAYNYDTGKRQRAFAVNLKSLTHFRYNYHQAKMESLFKTDKPFTAKDRKVMRFNVLGLEPPVIHYACDDAYLCLQLHHDQYGRILEDPYLPNVYNLEMQTMEVLVDMHEQGVSVDWEGIKSHLSMYKNFLHETKVATKKQFEEEAGRPLVNLNLNSGKQVREIIFAPKEEGGLGLTTTVMTDGGELSTNDKSLSPLKNQSKAVAMLLNYRKCEKMGKWFEQWAPLENAAWDGKIHPNFLQTTVASGRFSSAGPNVQQLTKHWWFQNKDGKVAELLGDPDSILGVDYWTGNARDFIVPSPGYRILSFDYQSAEIQFLAALAGEDSIIQAFYSGEDFHRWTASLVFDKSVDEVTPKERQAAKSVSFGLVYGQSVSAMAQQLNIPRAEAQDIRDRYFARFPHIAAYFDQQHTMAEEEFEVRTVLGRKATLWDGMHESNRVRSKAARMSVNIPVQGGATGDYVKMAMTRCKALLDKKGLWGNEIRLIMNQHDSLVFEVSEEFGLQEAAELITPCVQFSLEGIEGLYNYFESFPPMSVDWEAGDTWGSVCDLEDVKYLNAEELHVDIDEDIDSDSFTNFKNIINTNPGPLPVWVKFGDNDPVRYGAQRVEEGIEVGVASHPDVLNKLKKGDPDIGIGSPGSMVSAEFVL